MNIAVGKLGRSIKFKRKNWKDGAGNNEPATFIQALAKLNPQNLYYVIGKNDLKNLDDEEYLSIAPNQNIVDVWRHFDSKEDDIETWPLDATSKVNFDYGVIIGGISASVNITNKYYKVNKETGLPDEELGFIKPLNMFKSYASPIINFLNVTNIPWVFFTSDSRQLPIAARDLTNREIATLGTMNFAYDSVFFSGNGVNGQELISDTKHSFYGFGELVSLLDENIEDYNDQEKDVKIGFFFHKYNDKKRSKAIKSYIDVLDDSEVSVYGKWKEELDEGDERFKGSLTFDETQDKMKHTKYTLCYPIVNGDISAKWIEAVRAGVIPLFAPGYDKNKELKKVFGVPDILYVDSPETFKHVIDYLESDEDVYNAIREDLNDIYKYLKKDLINIYQRNIDDVLEMGS